MTQRWYPVLVERETGLVPLGGPRPFKTSEAAYGHIGGLLGRSRPSSKYEYRVLVDLASIDFTDEDVDAIRHLVLTNPVIAAIFRLGVHEGYRQRDEVRHG